jgi:GNAT superfamily N-acetyltransferase
VRLRVRELQPADADKLREAFAELSPRSRYFRFLTPKTKLTDGELVYLTQLDGHDHFAVVAVRLGPDGSEGDGIGVARAIRLPDAPDTAEVAVTVIDRMQGKGVGTALVTRLAAIAARREVRRLRCELASSNTRALEILHELAPTASVEHDGPVTQVELALQAPAHR